MASSCYVCGEPAEGECLVCGKAFCRSHGDRLCAQCNEQDEIERRAEAYEGLPSPLFFRGALAIAILAVVLEIGWNAYKSFSSSPAQVYMPPAATSVAQTPTPPAQLTPKPTSQPGTQPTSAPATPVPPAPTAAPPPPTPTAAPPPPTPTAVGITRYTVQSGDNLWTIAVKYGVSVEAIQAANNMGSSSSLQVGQVLVIPPKQ